MKTLNWATVFFLIMIPGIFMLRWMILFFPEPGTNHTLVDFRLRVLQYGLTLLVILFGVVCGIYRIRKENKWRTLFIALAVLLLSLPVMYRSGRGSNGKISAARPPKYQFTTDWVSGHTNEWKETLASLQGRDNIRALEIGSFEGRSAIWFLDHILTGRNSSITAIDIWTGDYEATFDHNMKLYNNPSKIIKLKGKSQDVLRRLPNTSFDFVYIDGSHYSRDALTDAVMSWQLLKPGGIMIFDDYYTINLNTWLYPHRTAKRGIDAFLEIFAPYLDVIRKSNQVAVRKRKEPRPLADYPNLRSFLRTVQDMVAYHAEVDPKPSKRF